MTVTRPACGDHMSEEPSALCTHSFGDHTSARPTPSGSTKVDCRWLRLPFLRRAKSGAWHLTGECLMPSHRGLRPDELRPQELSCGAYTAATPRPPVRPEAPIEPEEESPPAPTQATTAPDSSTEAEATGRGSPAAGKRLSRLPRSPGHRLTRSRLCPWNAVTPSSDLTRPWPPTPVCGRRSSTP